MGPVRGRASVHSTLRVISDTPAGGPKPEFIEYSESDTVQGGQLSLNLVAAHNVDYPNNKVSLSDLKPSTDPEFKCKGTVPLKNGLLTCVCYVRAEAPELACHKDVAGFDGMSKDSLRWLIIKLYAKSGFNNCRIQPLKRMTSDSPLRLFLDPTL